MFFFIIIISIKLSFLQILDADGIASPGEIVRSHDILINKQSATEKRDPRAPPTPRDLPDKLVVRFFFFFEMLSFFFFFSL